MKTKLTFISFALTFLIGCTQAGKEYKVKSYENPDPSHLMTDEELGKAIEGVK